MNMKERDLGDIAEQRQYFNRFRSLRQKGRKEQEI